MLCVTNTGCLETTKVTQARTKFGASIFGWKFEDTKDNDIEIKDLKVDPSTKEMSATSIVIRNNASDVYKAQEVLIDLLTKERVALIEERKALYEVAKQFAPAEVLKNLPIKLPL